ncbi:SWIB/MDM2 domain-containing protein [soil metagenome]|jgi:chromatin remodeling complex protein RSC6
MATPSKGSTKKSGSKKEGGRGRSNSAFMKPVQPDDKLAAVVGKQPMPRTEITKKMWDYIKKNDLQDPQNRRMINADEKLKPVFGGKKQVSMFEMTRLMNDHIKQ